jgi:hypothetical protein
MLTEFQRNAIISEIRSLFVVNNDNIPANAYIEELWQNMSTTQLYLALGNFRRMEA